MSESVVTEVMLMKAKKDAEAAAVKLKEWNKRKPTTMRAAGKLSFKTHATNLMRGRGKGSRTDFRHAKRTRVWDREHKKLKKIFFDKKRIYKRMRKAMEQQKKQTAMTRVDTSELDETSVRDDARAKELVHHAHANEESTNTPQIQREMETDEQESKNAKKSIRT